MGDTKGRTDDGRLPSKEAVISRFLSLQEAQVQKAQGRIKLEDKRLGYHRDFAKKQLAAQLD